VHGSAGSGPAALAANVYVGNGAPDNNVATAEPVSIAFGASPAAVAPTVVTGAASAVTTSGASLAGTVNPNGTETYTFEYGTTTTFGSLSAIDNAGDSNALQSITLPITGPAPNTTYRYRIVATNHNDTTTGIVRSFTTGT
jgi:hypothetical protein